MKGKRLTAALAATLVRGRVGAGTAAATGAFSSHRHDSRPSARSIARPARPPPEERDLPARRRHGHAGDHRRPLLPGRQQRAQRRPDAVHRLRHHLVGEAGRRPALPARLRPRLGLDRDRLGDRPENARRAHLAGPEQRDRRSRREPEDGPRARPEEGHEGRRRLDRGDHRRDPGRARLAHLAARLPGPGRHGRLPAGDEGRGRPRLDRRAGGRPQGRRAPRRRPRPLRPDDRRRPGRRQNA